MDIELFKDLDGKRLVQTVSHAFILSIFNHFGNVSLWLKQHVSLLFFVSKKVQILHHLLPSGNKYSQKLSETYHILKHWKTCWLVEVFEVLSVWFQYFLSNFSSVFHYIKKWIIIIFCIFDVLLLSALFFLGFQIMVLYQITVLYKVLYVPNKWWCCTTHVTHDVFGPNHGAGPHQYVELHSGYHHFPYGLLKTKKSLKTYTKKSRETFKNQRTTKRSISRKSALGGSTTPGGEGWVEN